MLALIATIPMRRQPLRRILTLAAPVPTVSTAEANRASLGEVAGACQVRGLPTKAFQPIGNPTVGCGADAKISIIFCDLEF
jgi:hypothetical protein